MMNNKTKFKNKDIKDFANKLFEWSNKTTAGHMIEPENIDKEKAKSFAWWAKKLHKKLKSKCL